jgi:predicted  nucleic acid-binding Zn-ribbon protein
MSLSPGPDAKARIQKLSQKELQEFFEEVPAAGMRFVASVLPTVDGFRPGSPAGIVRQKEALARRLIRPTANDRDFHGLYVIWRTWIGETQANAPLIQELIDKLEDVADNTEEPEARRIAIEQQVDSLLQQLKDESQQNRCTRETIERFFTFSPFPETPASRSIIASAKGVADVERDAKLQNLPNRLDQDEHEIKAIKSDLHALTDRVTSVARDAGKALDELPKLRAAIEEVSERVASTEKNQPQWASEARVAVLEKSRSAGYFSSRRVCGAPRAVICPRHWWSCGCASDTSYRHSRWRGSAAGNRGGARR